LNTVHNERIKLFAALLNTMAGSSFTLGVIAPVAAAFFYHAAGMTPLKVLLGGVIWTSVVGLLHLSALAVLGRLQP
jgi:hypothetical protein